MAKDNLVNPSQQILFDQAAKYLASEADQPLRCLFFADENAQLNSLPKFLQNPSASNLHLVISNRFDIYQGISDRNIPCRFTDFALNEQDLGAFDLVLIRISKEKLVNQHIIHQAFLALKPEGLLYLIGAKNEGIKSIDKLAQPFFGKACDKQKHKPQVELLTFCKPCESAAPDGLAYENLSLISSIEQAMQKAALSTSMDTSFAFNHTISSKPGVFGWQKIDLASLLLIDCGLAYLQQHRIKVDALLDLGAGSGLLALAFAEHLKPRIVCATDNNAAAIIAAKHNLQALQDTQTHIHIIASDCGDTITEEVSEKFDLIVCNPPFHQGFSISEDLSAKFIQRIKLSLKSAGHCLLVANQFVPYERLAAEHKLSCQALKREQGFKILVLKHA